MGAEPRPTDCQRSQLNGAAGGGLLADMGGEGRFKRPISRDQSSTVPAAEALEAVALIRLLEGAGAVSGAG